MGKVNRGFNLTALNGSIGAVTYVTRRGTTVARQKVPAKSSAKRTLANMTTRVRWMNIVRMWQVLNTVGWHPSFQNKTGLQSDFNMFMKANASQNPVYLTRGLVSSGAAVVAPVQITQGSLPSVSYYFNENQPTTNISMGGMTIGASTTLKTFSQAIITNNPGWANGDQITFVVMSQEGAVGDIPRITASIVELTLDINDDVTLLGEVTDANFLSVVEGKLCVGGNLNGGFAVVHSTGEGATYDVSSQRIVINNSTLAQYNSDAALTAAIESYGGISQREFLIPNYDTLTPEVPIP